MRIVFVRPLHLHRISPSYSVLTWSEVSSWETKHVIIDNEKTDKRETNTGLKLTSRNQHRPKADVHLLIPNGAMNISIICHFIYTDTWNLTKDLFLFMIFFIRRNLLTVTPGVSDNYFLILVVTLTKCWFLKGLRMVMCVLFVLVNMAVVTYWLSCRCHCYCTPCWFWVVSLGLTPSFNCELICGYY